MSEDKALATLLSLYQGNADSLDLTDFIYTIYDTFDIQNREAYKRGWKDRDTAADLEGKEFNRIEVIGKDGREFSVRDETKVYTISIQDEGRTLKLFERKMK